MRIRIAFQDDSKEWLTLSHEPDCNSTAVEAALKAWRDAAGGPIQGVPKCSHQSGPTPAPLKSVPPKSPGPMWDAWNAACMWLYYLATFSEDSSQLEFGIPLAAPRLI